MAYGAAGTTITGSPPACRVYRAAPAAITTGGYPGTALTFDTERFDTDNMHSTVSNTTRITFNTAGVYVVQGQVNWPTNGAGERYTYIRLNGATEIATDSKAGAAITDAVGQNVTIIYKFAATDYVELLTAQTTGGNLTPGAEEFSAVWVGLGT